MKTLSSGKSIIGGRGRANVGAQGEAVLGAKGKELEAKQCRFSSE